MAGYWCVSQGRKHFTPCNYAPSSLSIYPIWKASKFEGSVSVRKENHLYIMVHNKNWTPIACNSLKTHCKAEAESTLHPQPTRVRPSISKSLRFWGRWVRSLSSAGRVVCTFSNSAGGVLPGSSFSCQFPMMLIGSIA